MKRLANIMAIAGTVLSAACTGGGTPTGAPDRPATDIGPAVPSDIRVIDADTVDIDGTRYRLFGIDAPEAHQTCRAWGRTWDCGSAATEALTARTAGMTCTGTDTDRFGRVIGVCSSGDEDLNAWLVTNGWALAYRQFAEDYADEEEQARANKQGIHRGNFVEPWDWRRGNRLAGEDTFAGIASGPLDVGALADRMLRGDHAGVYGGWLDDSVFVIVNDAVAVSFGASLGTNPTPTGGAVWNGTLVGIDTRTRERVAGDAVIEIDDLAQLHVDIALTSIEDAQGQDRGDIHWNSVPVTGGTFRSQDADGSVEGRFYGSSHQEVGGIFQRDELTGAFGGTR